MQDRFKFRAWDTEEDRYASDEDICFDTGGSCDNVYDLVVVDDQFYIYEQCTGLRDKNGKLIYEGDIVEAYDYTIEHSQVVWDKGCYVLKSKDAAMYEHLSNYEKECKVIGNIHENPELLEENK